MKASKLIEELQTYIDRYGDLPVYMDNKDTEFLHEVEDIGIARENVILTLREELPSLEDNSVIVLTPEKIKT